MPRIKDKFTLISKDYYHDRIPYFIVDIGLEKHERQLVNNETNSVLACYVGLHQDWPFGNLVVELGTDGMNSLLKSINSVAISSTVTIIGSVLGKYVTTEEAQEYFWLMILARELGKDKLYHPMSLKNFRHQMQVIVQEIFFLNEALENQDDETIERASIIKGLVAMRNTPKQSGPIQNISALFGRKKK